MNGGGAFYTDATPHMTISHLTGPAYASPAPATSSATLNSILTTTASPRVAAQQFQHTIHQQQPQRRHQETIPIVPSKRKIRDISQSPPGTMYQLDDPLRTPPGGSGSNISHNGHPTTPTANLGDVSSEAVDCICGFPIDDGFSIACDICSRWCHSACFGIAPGGPVPDSFECWACRPRPHHIKESAIALQRERLGGGLLGPSGIGLGLGFGVGNGAVGEDGGKHRRRVSPSTERKARRGSTTTIESGGPAKKRRRPSVVQHPVAMPPTPSATFAPPPPTSTLSSNNGPIHSVTASIPITNGTAEEEHVDIDTEPWTSTYVPITKDIIPDDETRSKLRRQARAWRGVSAVSSSPPPPFASTEPVPPHDPSSTPPIAIRALPPTPSPLLPSTNPHCLPPSYATYTTRPLPSSSMLLPFHSVITPSASYLREPTNGYAGLGMPKPHVHLLGPPLGVALDARGVGSEGRFVRWGCRPNAVLRPVICREGVVEKGGIRVEKKKGVDDGVVDEDATEDEDTQAEQQRRSRRKAEKARADDSEEGDDGTTLGFAVFALRDLKEGEEVVLGWEWDDGHAIHRLPALLKAPGMLPSLSSPHAKHSPAELIHLRNQLSNILHALASTFTTCACGSSARDCALLAMSNVVDRLEDAGANLSDWASSDLDRRSSYSEHHTTDDEGRQERGPPYRGQPHHAWNDVDLGPLIGRKRGFRTRERVPHSGGLGGMEMVDEDGGPERRVNGKTKELRGGKRIVISTSTVPEKPKSSPGFKFSVVSPDSDGERRGKGKGKGKERAVDGDVDMKDGDDMDTGRAMPAENPLLSDNISHPDHITTASIMSSRAQPNLEPRPPDPPDGRSTPDTKNEDRMPPKMRKKWMHREVEARNSRQNTSPLTDGGFGSRTGSETIPFGTASRSGGIGLGIRFDIPVDHDADSRSRPPPPASLHPLFADCHQPDHDRHAHHEGLQEAHLMPPPPMPASLDPTTVSSQHTSPSTPPAASPPSPHLPTPSPPTHTFVGAGLSPHIVHAEHDGGEAHAHAHGDTYGRSASISPAMATSPLHEFANLSLLSPAMLLAQARPGGKPSLGMRAAAVPDNVGHGEAAEVGHDEDVDMSFGEDESREEQKEDVVQELAEEPREVEAAERHDEVEWSPLRRVEKVSPVESDVHAVSEHEIGSPPPPEPVAVPERITVTSPLDSVASTPAARPSPPPVPIEPKVEPKGDETGKDSVDQVEDVAEMELDEHPPDLIIREPSAPAVAAQSVVAPPPSHFFDTDDEDEWKRQMATNTSEVVPPSTAREHSSLPRLSECHEDREATPTLSAPRGRSCSEDSSRSVSPFKEVSRAATMEIDEPPPPSTTTVSSEPPPSSSTSSATSTAPPAVVENLQPSPEPSQIPPSTSTVVETTSTNRDAPPANQSNAPVARQESQEPTSPAAQPKVKLSLRDFALRKKKLREEMVASKSSQASPMSVTSALAADDGDANGGATPRSTSVASPAIPSLAPRWIRDPVAPVQENAAGLLKGKDVLAASRDSLLRASLEPTRQDNADGLSKAKELAAVSRDGPLRPSLEPSRVADSLAEITRRNVENIKAFQESTKHSAVKTEWLSELTKTCEELTGNVKLFEAAAAAAPPAPAPPAPPAPVPPALVAKPSDNSSTINGYHRVPSQLRVPSPRISKEPILLPALPACPPSSTIIPPPYPSDTREAKKELIDLPMSNLSASRPAILKPDLPTNPTSYLAAPRPSASAERSISPIGPDLGGPFHHFRRPSHEDGEIGEGPPPLTTQRSGSSNTTPFNLKSHPFPTNFPPPQSHSPPTGPRSFQAPSGSPTPSFSGGGSHYRPALPPRSATTSSGSAVNANSRPPPPSAPRALRQSMLSNRSGPSSSSYPHGGSQYIPRGPSADRDRDRERDWEHRHYRGPRRGGGGGRAR